MRRSALVAASVLLALGALDTVAAQQAASSPSSASVPHAPTVGATYPRGSPHSPITPAVAARLRALLETGDGHPDVFVKVGASATVNRNFLRCFAGPNVDLADHDELSTTLRFFNESEHADSFLRRSRSATVGWHAGRAVWGSPPPLVREVRDLDPRFAIVMYGTNDIELERPQLYASLMLRLTHMLTERGVIPILSTIMPRDDSPESDRLVSLYNAVVRGVAQRRQVPLIDLHRELAALPDHGLASDGVHPNVLFEDGEPLGCDFGAEGLQHGYNIRNLLTLQALDRLRRTVIEGEAAPDAPAPPPRGAGSRDHPIAIDALPFAHSSDTSRSPHRALHTYACGDQDESGPEVVYRVTLTEPTEIAALVAHDHRVDVDLHLLRDGECVARDDDYLALALEPGTYDFAVDTFVSASGDERSGEYLFVVGRTDRPSDPD
ncbi:MAG: SGNH/GDSL hydrolase family protein [Sandaracinaceae bacterium]|nr:SGNH/GDSL hydrolase family protein [Sandaracinaceae bacterium]